MRGSFAFLTAWVGLFVFHFATASELSMGGVRVGELRSGFRSKQLLTLNGQRPVGMRFEHARTGLTVIVTQADVLPQTGFLFTTPSVSDRGEAHTCEHLVLLKGGTASQFQNTVDAFFGSESALTYSYRTFYAASVQGGTEALRELLSAQFQAYLRPDFLDVDAQREAFEFGVERLSDGTLRLAEKGTIYNEMKDSERRYGAYYRAIELLFGDKHPYARRSGGEASDVRRTTVRGLRDFHRRNYRLDRGTLVMVSIPESVEITDVLLILGNEVEAHLQTKWARGSRRLSPDVNFPSRDFSRIAPEVVPYPSAASREPVSTYMVWPVLSRFSREDLVFLETFMNLLGRPQGNPMSRVFLEETRLSRLPKVSRISLGVENDFPALFPAVSMSGIDSADVTEAALQLMRREIAGVFRRIAEMSPHEGAYKELADQLVAELLQLRRNKGEELELSPAFGERRTGNELLLGLDQLKDSGPVVDASLGTMAQTIIGRLRSGENALSELIRRARLDQLPIATAGMPSPRVKKDMEIADKNRTTRKLASLRRTYQARSDQEALARLEQEELAREAVVKERDRELKSRPITDNPPMTRQLGVELQELPAISGVPVLAAGFSSWSTRHFETVFDLNGVRGDDLIYLPLLPELIRKVGLRSAEGAKTQAQVVQEMKNTGASVDFFFSVFESQNRYFLRMRVKGNADDEFAESIRFAREFIFHSDLTMENMSVVRNEIQAHITRLSKITSQPEEYWTKHPFKALLRQDSPLFMTISAPFTKLHAFHRLNWRLMSFSSEEERAQLMERAKRLAVELAPLNRSEVAAYLDARPEKDVLLNYIEQRYQEAPPSSAGLSMASLLEMVMADVSVGPEKAMKEMKELVAKILSRSRAQSLVAGEEASLPSVIEAAGQVLSSLPEGASQPFVPDSEGVLMRNLRRRGETFSVGEGSRYFGLIIEDMKNGTFQSEATLPGVRDLDRDMILDSLSPLVATGSGPHGFFSQTLAQGLAYSNGLGVARAMGKMSYYAERNGSVAATASFIEGIWKRVAQIPEDGLGNEILKSYFSFSQAYRNRLDRVVEAANVIWNGEVSDAEMVEYSRLVLDLSREPGFVKELKKRAERTIARTLIGQAPPEANATFLITGEERHINEVEERFSNVKVQRLWRSDFWVR